MTSIRTPPRLPDDSPAVPMPAERVRAAHARRRGRRRLTRRQVIRRRRIVAGLVVVVLVVVSWFAVSFGQALTNPALGSSISARAAEWFREHGLATVVNWAENEWYSHHPPKKGGLPPKGAIPQGRATPTTSPAASTVAHLPVPAPVVSPASPPLPGEGQWHPAGRTVDGVPAIYEAFVRPDSVHTSYVAGIAWMDTKLLSATLYSGSTIPGGGPFTHTAPITPEAATSLDAAFNAGFLLSGSNGGYYTDGQTQAPLVPGAASVVVYKDGSVNIGAWGQQVSMTPDVVSVRQNLDLIVNNGQEVPGLNANDTTQWGATLGDQVYVWRSGLGITADGALVYVAGSELNITDLANLLVRAGAVRAMELDINTDWVNYSTYDPSTPGGAATPANGSLLLSTMTGGPERYFQSWWSRDFFTMSVRQRPLETALSGTLAGSSAAASGTPSTTSRR